MLDKKKQQIYKWFSDEECSELASLAEVKAIVKVDHVDPNLYSQVFYTMQDTARLKDEIFDEITELNANQGDFIIAKILESILLSFISEFMDGDGNLGNAEEEVTVTRKSLYAFSGDLYAKIDAINHLKLIFDKFNRIRDIKQKIDLAKKGVLI